MATPRESSHELENLGELIHDFGVGGWTADRADEAFAEIAGRSLRLESFYEIDAGFVTEVTASSQPLPLGSVLEAIGRSVHQHLFDGILRIAGEYRKASDPGGGFVSFGGPKGQTTRPLFQGAPVSSLPTAIEDTFSQLADFREGAMSTVAETRVAAQADATSAAVLFYKDFSGVHPFYDANGRTARYVVSVYLLLHGLHVRWAALDERETKFMKRINECLKRRSHADPSVLTTYETYLVNFWRPFVEAIPDDPPLTA